MIKFKDYFHDPLKYLSANNTESIIWYEIRDNLGKWYIHYSFAQDSIGIDMLVEYTRKVNKIEEKTFFKDMVNLVLFSKLSEVEKDKVHRIAKHAFLEGLFYFEEEYILKFIEREFLQKCIEENILIQEDGKFKFQNVLLQTYLAACKIYEGKIEINDELFVNFIENQDGDYIDNQIQILYIFSMVNLKVFNSQYLMPKLERFLSKIDNKDDFAIAQSMIDMYEVIEEFGKEYPNLYVSSDEDYSFIKFLGLDIEGDIIERNYEEYDSMLAMKYLEEELVKIDYTKAKEDKILMKLLDEDGTVEMLVDDYKYLKKVIKKMKKNIDEDYCKNWEIKGINL